MEPSKEAPQQYKQPSRKGKKAWRKNVDVTDVEAGLQEAREEVIKGLVTSIVNISESRSWPDRKTAVSLPKNLLIPFSPLTPKARKPSKNPTIKFTNPSKQTKYLLGAQPSRP